jgi:hypothetical protein
MFEKWQHHLFGGIERIDIHCHASATPQVLRKRLETRYRLAKRPIPIHITADAKGVDFALVHYSTGLLRPAHADVVVMAS